MRAGFAFFLSLLSLSLLASPEQLNYFKLKPAFEGQGFRLDVGLEPVIDYEALRSKEFPLDYDDTHLFFDGPFRQVVYLLRTLERNRGVIGSSRGDILSFTYTIAARDVRGEPFWEREYRVLMGLEKERGEIYVRAEEGARRVFQTRELTSDEGYEDFVTFLAYPFREQVISTAGRDEFLLDLYLTWPRVEVDKDDFPVFDLFPSFLLWDQGQIRKLRIQLGAVFAWREGDAWRQTCSESNQRLVDAVERYKQVRRYLEMGDDESAIEALEAYVALIPSDQRAKKALMEAYLRQEMYEEAHDLIRRFRPFFATIREGLTNLEALQARAEAVRERLLERRAAFPVDEAVKIRFITPSDGDLVTGTTNVRFAIEGASSELLAADVVVDGKVVASLEERPYEASFALEANREKVRVEVRAFFENETRQRAEIYVDSIKVDQEERVNLVSLRAVVTQSGKRFVGELERDDVTLTENGEEMNLVAFRKDQAPLRLVILIDTSVSMFGPKLYRAQYAINSFIERLEPDDRVAIYTFQTEVIQLSDFTNQAGELKSRLYTLSPMMATSLYDAMLVAHAELEDGEGNKVMMVISDGEDSASATTDLHIRDLLEASDVMVYSVVLPGGEWSGGRSRLGYEFLEDMAELSGSVATWVRNVDKIDRTFDRIYEELRSFYHLEYYSSLPAREERKLRLDVNKPNTDTRFRAVQ